MWFISLIFIDPQKLLSSTLIFSVSAIWAGQMRVQIFATIGSIFNANQQLGRNLVGKGLNLVDVEFATAYFQILCLKYEYLM